MLNKELIEKKFANSIDCYDDNAIIQKIMADKLVSLIQKRKFKSILEIGSYSGVLTKKIIDKFEFEEYLALDIVDSFEKIKNLSEKISFKQIDVEKFNTDKKFDLIVANASLQWCNDFDGTIKKLKSYLADDGIFAITTFATDNFFEIRDTFKTSLNYKTVKEIQNLFSPSTTIIQEIHVMQFKNSKDLLNHFKLTGVNAIEGANFGISKIRKCMDILDKKYQNKLTYKPVYIIENSKK